MYRRGMGEQSAGGFRNPGPGSTYSRKDRRRVFRQGRTGFVGGNRPGLWVLPSGDGIRAGRFRCVLGNTHLPCFPYCGLQQPVVEMRSVLLASLMLAVCVALPTGASAQTAPASRETSALSAAMAEALRSPFHATPMPTTLGDLGSPHSHPALDPGTGRADGTLSRGRVFALTAIGAVVGHSIGWYWFLYCWDRCPGNLIRILVGPLAVAVVGPTVGSAIAGGDVSDSLGGSALGMVGSLAVYYGIFAAGFDFGPAFLLSSLVHAGIATAVVTR